MNAHISRRDFVKGAAAAAGGAMMCPLAPQVGGAVSGILPSTGGDQRFVKKAMFFKKLDQLRVECELCPRHCRVADMERGYCGVRENRGGTYYTLVHSRPCSVGPHDPIEKKPLFHYLPGTQAFSIATAGCNMECRFCQNWQISQFRPEQVRSIYMPPSEVARLAKRYGADTIAYTYSEPVIFYEFARDSAEAARAQGVGSVIISNGYINKAPLVEICKQLTAVKIDFKGFSNEFYRKYCSGTLQPVLDTLVSLHEIGIWYEIVVLLIPTLNDDPGELRDMCQWVYKHLGPDVPVHFSRFYPQYKIRDLPITPLRTLEEARNTALDAGLHYVYIGNVGGHPAESTYCPTCKNRLIRRVSYFVQIEGLKDGKCSKCGRPIPGVWSQEHALAGDWKSALKP